MASDEVSEEAVYTCTGNPMPRDVQQIVEWIMNQSFAEAFASAPSPPPPPPPPPPRPAGHVPYC